MSDTFISMLAWLTVSFLLAICIYPVKSLLLQLALAVAFGVAVALCTMSLVGFVALPAWMLPQR